MDGEYVNCTIARGRDNPPSDGDKSGAHAAIEQAMAMAQVSFCGSAGGQHIRYRRLVLLVLRLVLPTVKAILLRSAIFYMVRLGILRKGGKAEMMTRMQIHVKSCLDLARFAKHWLAYCRPGGRIKVQAGSTIWVRRLMLLLCCISCFCFESMLWALAHSLPQFLPSRACCLI